MGGVFIASASSEFKEKDRELLGWYRGEIKRLKIKINFNTEVKDIYILTADESL